MRFFFVKRNVWLLEEIVIFEDSFKDYLILLFIIIIREMVGEDILLVEIYERVGWKRFY